MKEIIEHKWQDGRGKNLGLAPFKILAVGQKWVMMRRKGAIPITAHINSFGGDKQYQKVIND